jgi:hypothetical protein
MAFLRFRPLAQARSGHHVDDLDFAAQPVHAVAAMRGPPGPGTATA